MKAIINGIEITGTPEEILTVIQSVQRKQNQTSQKIISNLKPKLSRTRKFARRVWSKEEDEMLRKYTEAEKPTQYIARILRRTPIAIYERRSHLRAKGEMKPAQ